MRHRLLTAVLVIAAACRTRPAPPPVRLGDLTWRTCPDTLATEVVNGSEEPIRVFAGEGYNGSPAPRPVGWLTTIRAGQSDILTTVQRTETRLWITAVDRPTEANGSLRKPIGYSRIMMRCVLR
jgi:hypothetical protein